MLYFSQKMYLIFVTIITLSLSIIIYQSFLFYGSSFQIDDLPKWKSDEIPWGLLHEESPRNNPILLQQKTLNLFTYSSTFSRFSDVPLTLVDLPGITELLSKHKDIHIKIAK
ncbi:Alpha-(1,3)-fucosyltransferase 10 [Melipona quadrifasciata]|uniref:Alpha-(1,3)-fucosyltransferase 10 n=1 Tax=Melipona quadrifasciata TaxID=166423 RepID=A0A0N0U3B4_9HYME|nr:Alpha-(1,3)-fucosyltransferase 10 [Melipona quadrifasciata]